MIRTRRSTKRKFAGVTQNSGVSNDVLPGTLSAYIHETESRCLPTSTTKRADTTTKINGVFREIETAAAAAILLPKRDEHIKGNVSSFGTIGVINRLRRNRLLCRCRTGVVKGFRAGTLDISLKQASNMLTKQKKEERTKLGKLQV